MAVPLGTGHADAAYDRLQQAKAHLNNDEVVHLDGSPPMFFFADPDGKVWATFRRPTADPRYRHAECCVSTNRP